MNKNEIKSPWEDGALLDVCVYVETHTDDVPVYSLSVIHSEKRH